MDEAADRDVRDRTYVMAVVVALGTGAVAVVCAIVLGIPLRDPDGFLGPTYVRLPLIAGLLIAADVVPRAVMRVRSFRGAWPEILRIARERWPWRRLRPVLIGLGAFYLTYVSYRNLKHYLPFLRPNLVDDELRDLDEAMTGGTAPAQLLHDVFGTGVSAHVLSWVYLAFLVFVPASLGMALVVKGRSRDASWYVTALCLNWSLGTASYYVLPSLGPVYGEPSLFAGLPETGTSLLQDSLLESRALVVTDPGTERVQSIAAFASLHVSIVLTAALIAQIVLTSVVARATMWVFFSLTAVATIYFGWHYIVDDVAGVAIAVVSVVLAAWGTGRFSRPAATREEGSVRGNVQGGATASAVARFRRRPEPSPSTS
jgi:hypothetical protein